MELDGGVNEVDAPEAFCLIETEFILNSVRLADSAGGKRVRVPLWGSKLRAASRRERLDSDS
ncbi:MAG: hypothetical protein V7K94_16445 [Nostoc sp.]|uniref:hypothetical protein n=1 Tax=Nostoc sp. TaxID=1180 RepID=UPI002FF48EA2